VLSVGYNVTKDELKQMKKEVEVEAKELKKLMQEK